MATWKVAPSIAGKSADEEFFERSLLARVPEEHRANLFTFQVPFARKNLPAATAIKQTL
jgi:hypothetical protein